MRKILIIGLIFSFSSCSETLTKSYDNYDEFNLASGGEKSWFHDLIALDCYNINEIHNLDNNCSFGKFIYEDSKRIIQIISDPITIQEILTSDAIKYISRISKPNRPSWFIDNDEIQGCATFRFKDLVLIHQSSTKIIYFVSNSIEQYNIP